jgi:hypothetical protein
MITKTTEEVNLALSALARMNCVVVWRSVGSNIFFEFGMPTLKQVKPKTRPPFTVVQGEAAISIHADTWYLRDGSNSILTSDSVNDGNLSKVSKEFLVGNPMPRFGTGRDGVLEMIFDKSIVFRIESNDYPDDAGSSYDEVILKLPELRLRFNYRHGFHIPTNEAPGVQ